jgi:acetyl esterase/lipase
VRAQRPLGLTALAKWVFGPGTTKSILDGPAKAVTAADPISYINRFTPPFVELQGSHDQLVSPSQTLLLNNALRAKGVDSTRYVVVGANHDGLTTILGNTPANIKADEMWSTRKVMGRILSFLRRHLDS